jgi:hypothetical protein
MHMAKKVVSGIAARRIAACNWLSNLSNRHFLKAVRARVRPRLRPGERPGARFSSRKAKTDSYSIISCYIPQHSATLRSLSQGHMEGRYDRLA